MAKRIKKRIKKKLVIGTGGAVKAVKKAKKSGKKYFGTDPNKLPGYKRDSLKLLIEPRIRTLRLMGYCECGFMVTTRDLVSQFVYLCPGCGVRLRTNKLREHARNSESGTKTRMKTKKEYMESSTGAINVKSYKVDQFTEKHHKDHQEHLIEKKPVRKSEHDMSPEDFHGIHE
jgi:hypothetical protein